MPSTRSASGSRASSLTLRVARPIRQTAKLSGSVAVIKVESGSGGAGDWYDDDGLNATRAGVEEGILPKLLKALLLLATKSTGGASNIPTDNFDQIWPYL
jgi:hypothetical protein